MTEAKIHRYVGIIAHLGIPYGFLQTVFSSPQHRKPFEFMHITAIEASREMLAIENILPSRLLKSVSTLKVKEAPRINVRFFFGEVGQCLHYDIFSIQNEGITSK